MAPRTGHRVGDVVSGTVSHVVPFGLFLDHDLGQVLVLAPDISWEPKRPEDHASVGDSFTVKIIQVPEGRPAVGSVIALSPDKNPWRDPSVYEVGTEHTGEVVKLMDYGVFVRVEAGAVGLILAKFLAPPTLELGAQVQVRVLAIDAELRKLELRLLPLT